MSYGAEKPQGIKEFNVSEMPMSFTAIVIGPPESGKTYLLQFFAYAFKHRYPVATATCGTEGSQGAFSPIFGQLYVQDEWKETEQIKHAKRQKVCIAENSYPFAMEIVDDCSDDPSIYNKKITLGTFKNGRQHWKRAFFLGLQYAMDVKPSIRKMVSYVFIFREPEANEREKIYKNFGGLCGSYPNFCKLMDDFTGDHTCLVIKKCAQSNRLEDCVFWFKAPGWKWRKDGGAKMHPYPEDWRFGSREYQYHNDSRVDPNYTPDIF